MAVRSVRLSEALWRRLEAAQAAVNQDRRRPASLSTVIRALLDRALDEHGNALDLDTRVVRPARVVRDRADKLVAAQAASDAPEVFRRASERIHALKMTPAAFADALGGDRQEAAAFHYRAEIPARDPTGFLERVKAWLAAQEAADRGQP